MVDEGVGKGVCVLDMAVGLVVKVVLPWVIDRGS